MPPPPPFPHPTCVAAAESIFEDYLLCAAPWWLGFGDAAPSAVSVQKTRDSHLLWGHQCIKVENLQSALYIVSVLAAWCCSRAHTHPPLSSANLYIKNERKKRKSTEL